MDLSKLGVWFFTDRMAAPLAADTAKRIEDLGFSALWIPETVGRNPFVHAAWLLANTSSLIIATGIANIYEVSTHLRGEAGDRQIEGAHIGMTHVVGGGPGMGTACAIHILEKV